MATGEDDGFSAQIFLIPEEGHGVFVASNWEDVEIEDVAHELLEALLKGPDTGWST